MMPENSDNPKYYQTLLSNLIKQIPPTPLEIPPQDNKIAVSKFHCSPKTYDGKDDPMELKKCIRAM